MVAGDLSKIRKHFIIQCLLDCEKWSTQDLIKEVNKSLNKYFNESENQPKKIEVNNAKMTPLLTDLIKKEIIDTEPIPKTEKKGRGPGGDRYWLMKNKTNYFNTLKEFSGETSKEASVIYGLHFIRSPFGKAFLNDGLLTFFESQAELTFDITIKNYILNIIKISPKALMELYEFPTLYIPLVKELNKPFYPWEKVDVNQSFQRNMLMLKMFLMTLTNSLIKDISSPYYPYFDVSSKFKPLEPIEVKNILIIKGAKNDGFKIQMNINSFKKDVKIEKI